MHNHDSEVRQRWGNTQTYAEHAQKTANYSQDKWQAVNDGLMAIFAQFASCMADGHAPRSPEAQELVKQLQDHITDNYYTCTKQILAGLGQMYVADARFQANIDQNGPGTAQFVCDAISIYCAL